MCSAPIRTRWTAHWTREPRRIHRPLDLALLDGRTKPPWSHHGQFADEAEPHMQPCTFFQNSGTRHRHPRQSVCRNDGRTRRAGSAGQPQQPRAAGDQDGTRTGCAAVSTRTLLIRRRAGARVADTRTLTASAPATARPPKLHAKAEACALRSEMPTALAGAGAE